MCALLYRGVSTADQILDLYTIIQKGEIQGFNSIESVAQEEDPVECCVLSHHTYSPGAFTSGTIFPVTAVNGDPAIFGSVEEAQAWIDAEELAVYRLAHGEVCRPDFKIIRAPKD